uniref:Uncharacterized protein n=1 Tax=Pinguiococcus pyrenoidosus TaxID=172671 RepID=A0A7R9UE09_9STRA|mmetsp:Transcript_6958/g.26813  ORF Transcript_6958/g.26813 Transcript_6958/m.26813 type:complete len:729 (+) Transcript_6958:43-2229(+)
MVFLAFTEELLEARRQVLEVLSALDHTKEKCESPEGTWKTIKTLAARVKDSDQAFLSRVCVARLIRVASTASAAECAELAKLATRETPCAQVPDGEDTSLVPDGEGTSDQERSFTRLVTEISLYACSLIRPGSPMQSLSMPRFYGSKKISNLLERMVAASGAGILTTTSSGNVVLEGVKGIGKTTLMKMVAITVSLAWDTFSIYLDYTRVTVPPCQAALRVLLAGGGEETVQSAIVSAEAESLVNEIVRRLSHLHGYQGLLVCGDEILEAYRDNFSGDGIEVMREFLVLGKATWCKGLLASSTTNLQRWLFHRGSDLPEAILRYPNMNHNVYVVHQIWPIDSQEETKRFCAVRFPGVEVPEELFKVTGGVGRTIESMMNAASESQLEEEKDRLRRRLLDKLQGDPDAAWSRLMQLFHGAERRGDFSNARPTISLEDATVICACTQSDLFRLGSEEDWILSGGGVVALTIPYDLELYEGISREKEQIRSMHALRCALEYFPGGAAKFAEKGVLSFVGRGVLGIELSTSELSYTSRRVEGSTEPSVSQLRLGERLLSTTDIDALGDLGILQWKGETGLDGVAFQNQEDGSVGVIGIQIKLSAPKNAVRKTVEESQERSLVEWDFGRFETQWQRTHPEGGRVLASRADDVVAGALVKALIGYERLAQDLRAAYPGRTFSFSRLHLWTSRKIKNWAAMEELLAADERTQGVSVMKVEGMDFLSYVLARHHSF